MGNYLLDIQYFLGGKNKKSEKIVRVGQNVKKEGKMGKKSR